MCLFWKQYKISILIVGTFLFIYAKMIWFCLFWNTFILLKVNKANLQLCSLLL